MSRFAEVLRARIEAAYAAGGYRLGWRLLASPAGTLQGADTAFLGLNPGGRGETEGHGVFAMDRGSAFVLESWANHPPGRSPLQQQVLGLFERLGVAPQSCLAGNLVPFRSPSWAALPDRRRALAFGAGLWQMIFARARPRLVVTMGAETGRVARALLGASPTRQRPLGWGRVCAREADFPGGRIVSLPHLSRYRVFGRPASEAALGQLFDRIER